MTSPSGPGDFRGDGDAAERGRHIDPERAAGLSMLDSSDPDWVQAHAHAAECPDCRERLERAALALAFLSHDQVPPAPGLGAVRSLVLKGLRPAGHPGRAAAAVGLTVSVSVLAALAVLSRGDLWHTAIAAPLWIVYALALSRALAALVRPEVWSSGGGLAIVVALAAGLGAAGVEGGPSSGLILKCAAFEFATSAAPILVAVGLARRGLITLRPIDLGLVGGIAALGAELVLPVGCHDQRLYHLALGHVGGVALVAALWWLAGAKLLPRAATA